MKRTLAILAVIVLLGVSILAGCAEPAPAPAPAPAPGPAPAPAPEETVILRLVIPSPPGDELTVNAEKLGEVFYERTNGKYQIKVYPGEALARIPEYMDAVRTGAVEMFSAGLGIYAGLDPGLAEIPMLYDNIRANAAACRPTLELYSSEILEKKMNQKGLGTYSTGGQELESNKPVKVLADWKGMMVGATNPESAALATSLGASPVVIPWTDCYAVLEKGVVDSVLTSMRWTIVSGLADVSSHVTLFYSSPTFLAYCINLDIFNKMSKDVQNVLVEESWRLADEMQVYQIKMSEEDMATLASLGMEVYELPKAERDKWKEACRPYVEQKLADLGDLGTKIRQIAEKANSENP